MSAPDPKRFGKVAVLMGGWSAERAVSLKSGAAVLAALQRAGVDAEAVDADRNVAEVLKAGGFDRAINMLHGRGGEDGTIQAALELMQLPYTGTGVLGCALAMDKLRSKYIWRGLGLSTPEAVVLRDEQDCEQAVTELGLPLAVKPVFEGSSVGISKVGSSDRLVPAWREARRYGEVMAERWVTGTEYTVSVLEGRPLPLIRLEYTREFYDYAAKYEDSGTQYHCPCGLEAAEEEALQIMAVRAFEALAASGWGRVDLIRDGDGRPWLIELNTVPGMTDHSLVPMAARAAGIDFDALVLRILATSEHGGRSDAG